MALRWGNKEAFPKKLEAFLPKRHFTGKVLMGIARHANGSRTGKAKGDATKVIAVISAKDVAPGFELKRKDHEEKEAVSDFRHASQSRVIVRVSRHPDMTRALEHYDYRLGAHKKRQAKGRSSHIRFRMAPELSAHAYVRWWRYSHSVTEADLVIRINEWLISLRGNFHGQGFTPEKARDILLRTAKQLVTRAKKAMGA